LASAYPRRTGCGVRAIDGFLTAAAAREWVSSAGSGVGRYAPRHDGPQHHADLTDWLIGERGREVGELLMPREAGRRRAVSWFHIRPGSAAANSRRPRRDYIAEYFAHGASTLCWYGLAHPLGDGAARNRLAAANRPLPRDTLRRSSRSWARLIERAGFLWQWQHHRFLQRADGRG